MLDHLGLCLVPYSDIIAIFLHFDAGSGVVTWLPCMFFKKERKKKKNFIGGDEMIRGKSS